MTYPIPKKLKQETRFFSLFNGAIPIFLKDVAFLAIWAMLFYSLHSFIHSWLVIPYALFAAVSGIYLMIPAKRSNPGKRNWEAILIMIGQDKRTFFSINKPEGRMISHE